HLAEFAKRYSQEKDYSLRVKKETEDEIGLLIDNFNQMLSEIQNREKTLSNQWQWLQNILDLMPTPFLLVEWETGRVTFANRAAHDVAGGQFPDVNTGPPFRENEMFSAYDMQGNLISAKDLPSNRLARGEKIRGFVIDWLTPKGVRTLVVSGDALPSLHGHSSIGVLTFHDITEMKKKEGELKKIADRLSASNAELAQSNKDLEQFAYIASHDLQEPLRKIITFNERLKEEGHGRLTEEEKNDFFTRMSNAALRMKSVVEDLLQFSRASRSDILFERISLKATVDEVLSDLEVLIAQAKAKIEVKPLPEIEANRAQMHHLFQNLITNAIKFSKKDARPEISIESRVTNDGAAEILVRDNGIGFDEKYSDRIFKPFQRLHGRDEYEGTGIGLAIVDKIVQNHRGKITAKSRPNEGATFIITLPLVSPPPEAAPGGSQRPPRTG
ncbi:MAG TPA: ATP-binding protein, partial [Candidatus Eisenbacteria bacterium]|nr:ATP-binding protein [Candidatus Eisenbacteria bacterium]